MSPRRHANGTIETDILPVVRELGIGLVPFSPLGRGFLTGAIATPDQLDADDFRRKNPRFQAEALAANLRLAETVKAVAADVGATPAQVALAWALQQGFSVIPSSTKRENLASNLEAAAIRLTDEDMAQIAKLDRGHRLANPEGIAPAWD